MRRQRTAYNRGGGSGSLLLIAILILTAVAAGYAGTKYFIAPYILEGKLWSDPQPGQENDPGVNQSQEQATGSGIVTGQQDVKDAKDLASGAAVSATGPAVTNGTDTVSTPGAVDTAAAPPPAQDTTVSPVTAPAPTGKFAVQFGSFSTKGSADKAVSELAEIKITASVLQRGDAFKVVGTAFDTKAAAQAEAERLRSVVADVYVTGI